MAAGPAAGNPALHPGAVIHLALLRPRRTPAPVAGGRVLGKPVSLPSPLPGERSAAPLSDAVHVPLRLSAQRRGLPRDGNDVEEAAHARPHALGRRSGTSAARPATGADRRRAALVALDVLAEYGTVALLRYETFSTAIFVQLAGATTAPPRPS